MKRKSLLFVAVMISMMLVFTGAQAVSLSGKTGGGTDGKTTAYGELTVSNSTSAGADYATAKTKSDYANSDNWSYARLEYVSGSGSGYADKTGSSTGTTWSNAKAKPTSNNYHGYKGVSSHVVNTDVYGGWSDSTSIPY